MVLREEEGASTELGRMLGMLGTLQRGIEFLFKVLGRH